jgi:hypothetical protein
VTRHVDAETLARFRQGDLSPRRNFRIRAHLTGCERCRALDEDLAGVTTLLAEAGAVGRVETAQPPPIPEHLAARIHAAIAAEATKRVLPAQTATPAPAVAARLAGAEPAETGAPRQGNSRHGRHGRDRARQRWPGFTSPVALRTMAAAAAVVVLAVGGYEIAQQAGGSSSSSSTAAGSLPPSQNGPYSGPAAAPAVPQPYLHAGRSSVPVIMSHTNYNPATLNDQVRNALARYGPLARSGSSAARSQAAAGGSRETSLTGCVTRVAAGRQVLLVDVARYQGRPATVIVTRASSGGPEQVWVVGPGCSSTNSHLVKYATLAPAG